MQQSGEDFFEVAYNKLMSSLDAASMFRAPISKTDKPYTVMVKKMNNTKVDEWEKLVLGVISNKDGEIKAGRIYPAWNCFNEGKEISKYIKSSEHIAIPRMHVENVKFFIDLCQKSMSEICNHGISFVLELYSYFMREVRLYFIEHENELVYKDTNIKEWLSKYHKHQDVFKKPIPYPLPFDLTEEVYIEIINKMRIIAHTNIRPNTQFNPTQKIHVDDIIKSLKTIVPKNEMQSQVEMIQYNNNLIDKWAIVAKSISKGGKLDINTAFESWVTFCEGQGILNSVMHLNKIPNMTNDNLVKIATMLYNSQIDELYEMGIEYVSFLCEILFSEVKLYIIHEKLSYIYSYEAKSKDTHSCVVWLKLKEKNGNLFNNEKLPFNLDKLMLDDIQDKYNTLKTVVISPDN
jgi:hypothetical protein